MSSKSLACNGIAVLAVNIVVIVSRVTLRAKFKKHASNFEDNILYDLPNDDKELIVKIWSDVERVFNTIISNKRFFEKVWNAAVEHDYIPEEFESLLIFMD